MQNYSYPSSSQVTITGIGDPTGQPVPSNAVYIAADNPSGNLTGLKLTSSGALQVDITSVTPTSLNINLADVGGSAITLGQKTEASSIPVVVASDQSTLPVSAASLPLPTGAATSALQSSVQGSATGGTAATSSSLSGGIFNTSLPTLTTGQQSSIQLDSSGRVILSPLASSSTVTVVQPTGTNLHTVVDSGTVAATQSGTWTVQPGNTANTTPWLSTISQGGNSATVSAGGALKVDASASTQPVSGTVTANQGTSPWVNNITQVGGSSIALGQTTMVSSIPVVIASNQSAISVTSGTSSTATSSSVASSATSVQLLASNTSRKNATFFNDSTSILYLKLGTTASTSSYAVQIPSNGYYELPNGSVYTGEIDGIWSSANGNVRITELT